MSEKKGSWPVRAYNETRQKINQYALELSYTEGKKVTAPEVLRRAFNIPGVKETLVQDSMMKKTKRMLGGLR